MASKPVRMKPTKVWAVVRIYNGEVLNVHTDRGQALDWCAGPTPHDEQQYRPVALTIREPRRTRRTKR